MSELIKTCVTLTPKQKAFIDENSISLSKMLHAVLDRRIQESEKTESVNHTSSNDYQKGG